MAWPQRAFMWEKSQPARDDSGLTFPVAEIWNSSFKNPFQMKSWTNAEGN